MGIERRYNVDDQLPPLTKTVGQEAIICFETSGGHTGPSQFTDHTAAQERLGTRGTVASGRMTLSFTVELLRR